MADIFEGATNQNSSHLTVEDRIPVIRQQNGLFTELPVVVQNNLVVTGTASLASVSGTNINLAQTAILVASGASVAIFAPKGVGGVGQPTTATQYGWTEITVAGTSAWIPIWH